MKKVSVILAAAAITTTICGTAALAAGSSSPASTDGAVSNLKYSCSYCQDANIDRTGSCMQFYGHHGKDCRSSHTDCSKTSGCRR